MLWRDICRGQQQVGDFRLNQLVRNPTPPQRDGRAAAAAGWPLGAHLYDGVHRQVRGHVPCFPQQLGVLVRHYGLAARGIHVLLRRHRAKRAPPNLVPLGKMLQGEDTTQSSNSELPSRFFLQQKLVSCCNAHKNTDLFLDGLHGVLLWERNCGRVHGTRREGFGGSAAKAALHSSYAKCRGRRGRRRAGGWVELEALTKKFDFIDRRQPGAWRHGRGEVRILLRLLHVSPHYWIRLN